MLSVILKTRYNIRFSISKTKIQFYFLQEIEKMGPKSKQTKKWWAFCFFLKIDVNFDPLSFFPLVIKFFTF
jgi:hypothetical protein